jgi:hypothetical protein
LLRPVGRVDDLLSVDHRATIDAVESHSKTVVFFALATRIS